MNENEEVQSGGRRSGASFSGGCGAHFVNGSHEEDRGLSIQTDSPDEDRGLSIQTDSPDEDRGLSIQTDSPDEDRGLSNQIDNYSSHSNQVYHTALNHGTMHPVPSTDRLLPDCCGDEHSLHTGPQSCISALTDDEISFRMSEIKAENKKLDVQKYVENDKPYILNHLVQEYDKGQCDKKNPNTNALLAHQVNHFVENDIRKQLEHTIFTGKVFPCGSVEEGAKVGQYDEFDFIYELGESSIDARHLSVNKTRPTTFRTEKKNSRVGEKSYFALGFKNHVSCNWDSYMKCRSCALSETPPVCTPDHPDRLLHSPTVQMAFMEAVQRAIHTLQGGHRDADNTQPAPRATTGTETGNPSIDDEQSRYNRSCEESSWEFVRGNCIRIEKNGPAATIFLASEICDAPRIIKVDLTLAIRMPYHMLREHGLVLNDGIVTEDHPLECCHLVCTGDHWRASFVQHETERLQRLTTDMHKQCCFKGIKTLRDELSVSGSSESQLLPTYPLKVSFFKEQASEEPWSRATLGNHTVRILGRLVQEGTNGGQTSYYIQDDLVNPGKSSRSHWEALRMMLHLEKKIESYGRQGCRHTVLLIIFIIIHFALIMFNCLDCAENSPINTTISYPTFLSLMFILAVIGLVWVRDYATDVILYRHMRILLWVYSIMLINSLLVATLLICSSLTATAGVWCFTSNPFIGAIVILSSVLLLVTIIHLVLISVFGHERCKRYSYPDRGRLYRRYFCCEVVFFGPVYREIGCRCC